METASAFDWLVVEESDLPSGIDAALVSLSCEETPVSTTNVLAQGNLVINPASDLPENTECSLELQSSVLARYTIFQSPSGPSVLYDRSAPRSFSPLPDDFFLEDDASSATGVRPVVTAPDLGGGIAQQLVDTITSAVGDGDGWSPNAPITIGTTGPVDVSTISIDATESRSPLSTIQLFDLTPDSPGYGQRVPFVAQQAIDTGPGAGFGEATISVFPSVVLKPEGTYGVVVLRRAVGQNGGALEPSPSFVSVLSSAVTSNQAILDAREITGPLIEEINTVADVPLDGNDIALALRFTIGSSETITAETLSLLTAASNLPVPSFSIMSVNDTPENGVIVRGEWIGTDFRDPVSGALQFDMAGVPASTGTMAVPFTLVLPNELTNQEPSPLIMVQHGNPGDADQTITVATNYVSSDGETLIDKGFAAIGFTDAENRERDNSGIELSDLTTDVIANLLINGGLSDQTRQSWSEQIAFVKLLNSLSSLDILPLTDDGRPGGDGIPDLNPQNLLYYGGSEGANKGFATLPFQPDIVGAVLSAGGARLADTITVNDGTNTNGFLNSIEEAALGISLNEAFTAASLLQSLVDPETPANFTEFFYSNQVSLAGNPNISILIQEGLQDSFVPNVSTRATAAQISELRHVTPVLSETTVIETVPGPLSNNVNGTTTAGFFQFAPSGIVGTPPSPGCAFEPEGHFCAQNGTAAVDQFITFFETALDDEPVIVDTTN
ncbi:MAG: hypothetical protein AAF668_01320 [Pseudomonadota bacterium]